ncbi:hypothetical protein [Nostoc sp. CMAA1605]|nr:hypothetical protein [Nostoc sp. CMAA1605]
MSCIRESSQHRDRYQPFELMQLLGDWGLGTGDWGLGRRNIND